MKLFRLAVATCVALFAAMSIPAWAQAPGSRNFEPPSAVPNYFSNEAGPFRGGAGAETTYSNPGPAPTAAAPAPSTRIAAAPRRSASRHVARSSRHARYARYAHARGRGGSRYAYARSRSAHRTAHVAARSTANKSKTAAAKKPAVTRAATAKRQPASAKGHRASGNGRRATHTASR